LLEHSSYEKFRCLEEIFAGTFFALDISPLRIILCTLKVQNHFPKNYLLENSSPILSQRRNSEEAKVVFAYRFRREGKFSVKKINFRWLTFCLSFFFVKAQHFLVFAKSFHSNVFGGKIPGSRKFNTENSYPEIIFYFGKKDFPKTFFLFGKFFVAKFGSS
jgi:hypothetical protein